MVDKKLLSEIIADEYDTARLINENDIITEDVIAILNKKQSRFLKCFVPYKDKNLHLFKVELPCEKCGKLTLKECSKTKLQEYCFGGKRRNRTQFICDKCKEKEEKDKEKQKAINEVDNEKVAEQYISYYLNPNNAWKKETSQHERETCIEKACYLILGYKVREHILQMEYGDFLNTPYWKAIAGKIRRKAGYRCQICGKQKTLSVHHRSYENHGLEHTYAGQRDLIAICQDCHEKFHFE